MNDLTLAINLAIPSGIIIIGIIKAISIAFKDEDRY